jgi:hypothetical protein
MTPILMSAQRVFQDGGHFSLSWGLHPDGAFLECSLTDDDELRADLTDVHQALLLRNP